MYRIVSFLLGFILIVQNVSAHYSIHSYTPGVMVETGGKSVKAEKGLEVKANEYLVIPEGGEVEIYNDLDKSIYKSISSGKMSVTKLMIEAKKTASDNNKNVASRLRFARNNGGDSGGEKIYIEKGMVRRSLSVFDPEAQNLQVDPKTLSSQIARFINSTDTAGVNNVAIEVNSGKVDSTGIYFRIVNTLDFPVYFNVLKFDNTPEPGNRKVEISMLGQPDGSYVLLPGQAITRECFKSLPEDEKHLLVVTHFRYDLDEVVDETVNSLNQPQEDRNDAAVFPLLIKNL